MSTSPQPNVGETQPCTIDKELEEQLLEQRDAENAELKARVEGFESEESMLDALADAAEATKRAKIAEAKARKMETENMELRTRISEFETKFEAEGARFANLETQVKLLQRNENDIVQAAKSTEAKCNQQLQKTQGELSKAQAEATLLKNALQKMVDQFNVLVEGVQIAQKKGVYSLEIASHMHTAISTVAGMFDSKQGSGTQ